MLCWQRRFVYAKRLLVIKVIDSVTVDHLFIVHFTGYSKGLCRQWLAICAIYASLTALL